MPSVSGDTWSHLIDPWDTLLKVLRVPFFEASLSRDEVMDVLQRVTLYQEYSTGAKDPLGRFDESAVNWQYQRPVVNEWLQEKGSTSSQQGFQVVFSHDVDWVTTMEPLSIVKSLMARKWGQQRSWVTLSQAFKSGLLLDNLKTILQLEQQYQVGAYYFMLAGPYGWGRYSSRYDASWSWSRKSMDLINQYGAIKACEAGSYAEEARHLSEVLGAPVKHHRNHYLRFNPQNLWQQLEGADMAYDFSVGYVNHMGYRAGLATAYQGYDWSNHKISTVTEVPLIFMDRFPYLADKEGTIRQLEVILKQVRTFNGCVSILFHPEMYLLDQGCLQFYKQIIELCLQLGADVSGKLP